MEFLIITVLQLKFLDLRAVPEIKRFCWELLSVEINSLYGRLMLSDGQEINAGLELGTVRVSDVSFKY